MSNAATGQPSPRSIYSSAGRLDDHGHQRFRLPSREGEGDVEKTQEEGGGEEGVAADGRVYGGRGVVEVTYCVQEVDL